LEKRRQTLTTAAKGSLAELAATEDTVNDEQYDSIKFVIKAAKSADWKMDEQQKEYDRHESIKVEKPTEVSVQEVSRTVK